MKKNLVLHGTNGKYFLNQINGAYSQNFDNILLDLEISH